MLLLSQYHLVYKVKAIYHENISYDDIWRPPELAEDPDGHLNPELQDQVHQGISYRDMTHLIIVKFHEELVRNIF